jgi:hypothetical protein
MDSWGFLSRHRMNADHVPFGIEDEGDVTIVADGEFFAKDLSAVGTDAASLFSTVLAGEINERAAATGSAAFHLAKSSGAAGIPRVHGTGERPHFQLGSFTVQFGARERLEFDLQHAFIKGFRAGHLGYINFKPADRITFWIHDDVLLVF